MIELSVIIPFLNEGEEIYNTVNNLRETAGDKINIILINDASGDGYNYESVARKFDAKHIIHNKRKGVAASRDEAINICPTDYFLLLDGHMRFFQTDWVELIVEELKRNDCTLLCCQSLSLMKDNKGNVSIELSKAVAYGAYIEFTETGNMQARWSTYDPAPEQNVIDIPCILGAGYATSKEYWKYLGGLKGLYSYGMDEQLISLKAWMEGGRCKLLKHVKVGHLYRTSFPYVTADVDLMYNILFVAELLLPIKEKHFIFKFWETYNEILYKEAFHRLKDNKAELNEMRVYNKNIFKFPVENVLSYNEFVKNKTVNS